MRIVADENVERPIVQALRAQGYEVDFITELSPGMKDSEVLHYAAARNALLLTRDKDFRQLAIDARRPCSGVLYVRLHGYHARDKIVPIVEVLNQHGDDLLAAFSTLTPDGFELEPLPEPNG